MDFPIFTDGKTPNSSCKAALALYGSKSRGSSAYPAVANEKRTGQVTKKSCPAMRPCTNSPQKIPAPVLSLPRLRTLQYDPNQ